MNVIRLFGKVFYKDHVHGMIGVEINVEDERVTRYNIDALTKKTKGWAFVEIKAPAKPISRGPRSKMNRIHGHCSDVANQLNMSEGTSYTTEDVKEAMKRIAVRERYYPVVLSPDGLMMPDSLANATQEDADAVLETIADFASLHNFYLTEVDDNGIPYKTIHGQRISEEEKERPRKGDRPR